MFCPKCGAEYKEGITECADCQVRLDENPPPPVDHSKRDFVTVLETSDPALISMAKSLLDGEGLEYFVYQERIQDLFGGGRLGGINLLTGPVLFQVEKKDAARAKAILKELLAQENPDS
jgi:hypothetical protein